MHKILKKLEKEKEVYIEVEFSAENTSVKDAYTIKEFTLPRNVDIDRFLKDAYIHWINELQGNKNET